MRNDAPMLALLLDRLTDPLVYCDTDHVIRYWNAAAAAHYAGETPGVGASVLECHNAASSAQIVEIAERFAAEPELEEVLIADSARHRVWMRAVRDENGTLLGYFERYGAPARD
jgi:hypothetical protein